MTTQRVTVEVDGVTVALTVTVDRQHKSLTGDGQVRCYLTSWHDDGDLLDVKSSAVLKPSEAAP